MQKVQLVYGIEYENMQALYVVRAEVMPGEPRTYDSPGCGPSVDVMDAELLEVYDENGQLSVEQVDVVRESLNSEFWTNHEGKNRLHYEILEKAAIDLEMAREYAMECKMDQMREEKYG